MNIYVVRHGQTNWNVEGKVQGQMDIELNDTGIEQARSLSKNIANENFDVIISSDLKRAYKTTQIINENHKLEIQIDKRLRERGYGDYSGYNKHNMEYEKLWTYELNYKGDNVEPFVDFVKRVEIFIKDSKSTYKGKNVLFVTHGWVARVIEHMYGNLPINSLHSYSPSNASYKKYVIK